MEPVLFAPVPYAQLLEDLRAIFRHETNQRSAPVSGTPHAPATDLLTMQEAAEMLDVWPQTVHEWKRCGLLTYHQMGRRTYLKRAEVLAALKSEKRTVKTGKRAGRA